MPPRHMADEVRRELDRLHEKDYPVHGLPATIEAYAELVVENGIMFPDAHVEADIDLPLRARITGTHEQDVTVFLVLGMILGTALERDVPKGSDAEDVWRDGEFELPERGNDA